MQTNLKRVLSILLNGYCIRPKVIYKLDQYGFLPYLSHFLFFSLITFQGNAFNFVVICLKEAAQEIINFIQHLLRTFTDNEDTTCAKHHKRDFADICVSNRIDRGRTIHVRLNAMLATKQGVMVKFTLNTRIRTRIKITIDFILVFQ